MKYLKYFGIAAIILGFLFFGLVRTFGDYSLEQSSKALSLFNIELWNWLILEIKLLSKYPDSKSKSLRREIAKRFRCNFDQIICGSGSDEIIQMICQLFLTKSDEVIVPNFSYIASAEVIKRVGATPIFVDIKRSDFNINEDLIANGKKTFSQKITLLK